MKKQNIKAFLQSINNFKDKFFIVNKFLQKYEDLELKFNENEIKIFKRKEVIEHEKTFFRRKKNTNFIFKYCFLVKKKCY